MNTIEIKANDVLLGDYTLVVEVNDTHILTVFKETSDNKKVYLNTTVKPGKNYVPLETRFNDGQYTILLQDKNQDTLDSKELKAYGGLLTYIRKGINDICFECDECKKSVCNGCNDTTTKDFNLFLAVMHYYNLNFVTYYPIHQYVSSLSFKEMDYEFTKFIISSKASVTKTPQVNYRRMILLYYSSIVLGEVSQAKSKEEEDLMKETYGYDIYKSCFNKENFRLDDMLEAIKESTRIYYWQTTMSMSIDPLADNLDLPTLMEKRSEKYGTFENGFIVELDTIGKLVFAVRYTGNQEYVITDMLGNDVTDSFETKFIPELGTRIFLSKVHYVNSQIYFKFKHKEKQ